MNHEEARSTGAAERYLLGEMTAAERDRFEEHFFSCAKCGEEMVSAASLVEGIRTAGAPEACAASPQSGSRPFLTRLREWGSLPSWGFASAAAAFAAIILYQSLIVIPRLREAASPRQVAVNLLRAEVRGSARVVKRSPGEPVVLSLDVPVVPSTEALEASVQSRTGQNVAQIRVTLPQGESRAFVLLPASLGPELYTIVLRSNYSEIARYEFALENSPK